MKEPVNLEAVLLRNVDREKVKEKTDYYTLFHLEVEELREILKKNSHPCGIIELSIRTFLNRLYVSKQVYSTAPKKELLIILHFLEPCHQI